jgi:hypothetical protein
MQRLRRRDACAIDPGLSETEFERIEREFGFRFSDDHRAFLAAGLPVNTWPEPREPGVFYAHAEPWPDWRGGDRAKLRGMLAWPGEGVLFDVENNSFWDRDWGPRPPEPASALAIAADRLAQVPTLVPIYGHRYLPAGPGFAGHPVLSVWQTDIIHYGLDIADYIDREFSPGGLGDFSAEPEATVGFWRDFL